MSTRSRAAVGEFASWRGPEIKESRLTIFLRIDVVADGPFASRLAPTFEMHPPVGASLLAKYPHHRIAHARMQKAPSHGQGFQ
ncbi:hypothetical protein C0J26_13740 [Pseudomonas baetica]|nr:hypothetical protein C0J26_13740 [Pseudomonas baetica]